MQTYWEKIYDRLMDLSCITRNVVSLSVRQMALVFRILRYVHTFTYNYLPVSYCIVRWPVSLSLSFHFDRLLLYFFKTAWQLLVNVCYYCRITVCSEYL